MLIDIARHHYLEQRLTDVTLTVLEFQEYCWLEAHRSGALLNGLVLPDLNLYVTDAMLLQYWQAMDWWPRDLDRHPAPTLREFAMLCPHLPDATPLTLLAMLEARAATVVTVLQSLKRNVANPNESKEQRAKRLNRERVSRARGRKDAGSVPVPQGGADVAVAGPVPIVVDNAAAAARAEVRAAAKLELEQVDAWVKAAHAEMLARAAVRRERRAYWDEQLAALKSRDGGSDVPPVPVSAEIG
jgi:hypothetical protein